MLSEPGPAWSTTWWKSVPSSESGSNTSAAYAGVRTVIGTITGPATS